MLGEMDNQTWMQITGIQNEAFTCATACKLLNTTVVTT